MVDSDWYIGSYHNCFHSFYFLLASKYAFEHGSMCPQFYFWSIGCPIVYWAILLLVFLACLFSSNTFQFANTHHSSLSHRLSGKISFCPERIHFLKLKASIDAPRYLESFPNCSTYSQSNSSVSTSTSSSCPPWFSQQFLYLTSSKAPKSSQVCSDCPVWSSILSLWAHSN